jgi:SPP1 gp7 family putative phage head morphogenesis protein
MGYGTEHIRMIPYSANTPVTASMLEVWHKDRCIYKMPLRGPQTPQVSHSNNTPDKVHKALISEAIGDLDRWERKISSKGIEAPFNSEYIQPAVMSFIKMGLHSDNGTEVFVWAKSLYKQAMEADPDFPTLEEFNRFWQGVDDSFDDLQRTYLEFLNKQMAKIVAQLRDGKSPEIDNDFDDVINLLVGTEAEPGPLTSLVIAGSTRGNDLLKQPKSVKQVETLSISPTWDVVLTDAVEFARSFANNQFVGINTTTTNTINNLVADFIESGESMAKLAAAIEGEIADTEIPPGTSIQKARWLTSPERAAMIAQTESTEAFARGVENRWSQVGVKEVRWRTQNDPRVCPICKDLNNETLEINGTVKGSDGKSYRIPAHPGCRCFYAPVL